MLINAYNPTTETNCPKCGHVEDAKIINGNLYSYPRYVDLKHEACGSEWRLELDKDDE